MTRHLDRPVRRRVALLGILAILLHAILFGWHHHGLVLPAQEQQSVAAASTANPSTPAAGEDGCEICAALHHLSAAPGEFASLALPPASGSVVQPPELVLAAGPLHHGFYARAPPRAQHRCV
jgi:hypothetical protein